MSDALPPHGAPPGPGGPTRYWRTPLDAASVVVPRGEVRVISERCKGCGFCVEYCPRDVLAMSEAFNRKGYHFPEAVKPEACIDCGLCELICPDFAVYNVPLGDTGVAAAAPPDARRAGA